MPREMPGYQGHVDYRLVQSLVDPLDMHCHLCRKSLVIFIENIPEWNKARSEIMALFTSALRDGKFLKGGGRFPLSSLRYVHSPQ